MQSSKVKSKARKDFRTLPALPNALPCGKSWEL